MTEHNFGDSEFQILFLVLITLPFAVARSRSDRTARVTTGHADTKARRHRVSAIFELLTSDREASVPEMPSPREHHREAVFVRGGDHLRVAHRSAGLHDRGRAGGRHRVEAVAERKERVGRGD